MLTMLTLTCSIVSNSIGVLCKGLSGRFVIPDFDVFKRGVADIYNTHTTLDVCLLDLL
jgi:hypothetical protein